MAARDIAMATAKVAAEVFASSRAMERIEQDGYPRVVLDTVKGHRRPAS